MNISKAIKFFLFIGMVIAFACGTKDDPAPVNPVNPVPTDTTQQPVDSSQFAVPTIAIISSSLNSTTEGFVEAGNETFVAVTFRATAAADFRSIIITSVQGTNVDTALNLNQSSQWTSLKNHQQSYSYTVAAGTPAGSTITLRLRVTDRQNRVASTDFRIMVVGFQTEAGLSMIAPGTQGNEPGLSGFTLGAYFNGSSRTVVNTSTANAQVANIDFAFDYIGNQPQLVAPDVFNAPPFTASGKNATRFRAVTTDFDQANAPAVLAEAAPTSNSVVVVENGVYLYQVPNGRRALVRVNQVVNVDPSVRRGGITFDVKIIQ